MQSYTLNEMLTLWKRQLHLLPMVDGAVVTRADDSALNELLTPRIEQWYSTLLQTAPVHLLPVEDLRTLLTVTADEQGVVTCELPENVVRPVQWKLAGWQQSVTEFLSPDHPIARKQANEWIRGGCANPVGVRHNRTVWLYSLPAGTTPILTEARTVVMPVDHTYRLDASLLNTIESWAESLPTI